MTDGCQLSDVRNLFSVWNLVLSFTIGFKNLAWNLHYGILMCWGHCVNGYKICHKSLIW